MSKSQREKKQRRAYRKYAQTLDQIADHLEHEGRVPAEIIAAAREAADLDKTLGTIRGRRKLRARRTKNSN
jgi:hypothetical protein